MGPKHTNNSNDFNDFQIPTLIKLIEEETKNNSNIIFSPHSLYLPLCLLLNGTLGNTQKLIQKYLCLKNPLNLTELNEYNLSLGSNFFLDDSNICSIVNAIFTTIKLQSEFVALANKYYDCTIDKLESVEQVNDYIADKTKNKIKHVIDDINDTKIIIVNTIYFLSEWKYPFDKDYTRNGKFNSKKGKTDCLYMNNTFRKLEDVSYYSGSKAEIIILPYKLEDFICVIILPKKLELNDYINSINEEDINNLINKCKPVDISLTIPKVKIEYAAEMNKPIAKMGVDIFKGAPPKDYSKLSLEFNNLPVEIDIIVKYTLDIDEKGTEASMVSVVKLMQKCVQKDPVKMVVDRPFLYCLKHKKIDKYLMLAKIEDL